MSKIRFLNIEEVVYLHFLSVTKYGGAEGIRDLSLLESAVQRPQSTFGGKSLYPSIFDKAAALMHSLVMNHTFVDGNKRVGVMAAYEFLYLNGWEIKVSQADFYDFVVSVITEKKKPNEISVWLKEHSVRV